MSEYGDQKKPSPFFLPDDQEDEFEEPIEMQVIKKKYLPQDLTQILPFDPENQTQHFYRQSKNVDPKSPLILNHGWKIAQIGPEQEALTLFCFSIFEATLQIPLNFNLLRQATQTDRHSQRKYAKFLWMETSIMITGVTRNQFQQNIEYSYYTFAKERLIPIFVNFVRENFVWSKMIAEDYDEGKVIDKFNEQVIEVIRERVYNFRIGEDYSLNQQYEKEKKMKKELGLE